MDIQIGDLVQSKQHPGYHRVVQIKERRANARDVRRNTKLELDQLLPSLIMYNYIIAPSGNPINTKDVRSTTADNCTKVTVANAIERRNKEIRKAIDRADEICKRILSAMGVEESIEDLMKNSAISAETER